ncbi:MAG: PEP-CTERM sorting domain-containing protein [Planctomycetes bacterium]|nr:PEP-CTERM sorting domain-containing protein [Planctomycetota bacterium]
MADVPGLAPRPVPPGWRLDEATGISDDGCTIVGYGSGPLGLSEGWVVTIPEPATLLLLAIGIASRSRRVGK